MVGKLFYTSAKHHPVDSLLEDIIINPCLALTWLLKSSSCRCCMISIHKSVVTFIPHIVPPTVLQEKPGCKMSGAIPQSAVVCLCHLFVHLHIRFFICVNCSAFIASLLWLLTHAGCHCSSLSSAHFCSCTITSIRSAFAALFDFS